jgi:predicted ATPase
VLDNFEQVIEAAPVVGNLLGAGAGLRVLITSREALRLNGEQEFPVAPLPVPERDLGPASVHGLGAYAGVRLFLDRVTRVRPDFALTEENAEAVGTICRRLDGLPLALELAAARMKMLSPRAMLSRLDHRLALLTGGSRSARPPADCATRSAGATTCSVRPSGGSSGVSPSSRAAARWRWRRRFATRTEKRAPICST